MEDELRNRFLNLALGAGEPTSNTNLREGDYRKWARKPYWSGEECVALSFAIEPHQVSSTSRFSRGYGDILEQIRQAQRNRQLLERIRPVEFLDWARQNNVHFPDELEKAVSAIEVDIEQLEQRCEQLEQQLGELRSENQKLKSELDRLRGGSSPQPKGRSTKEPSKKERTSLNKLIIGMALEGYKWNPKAERNQVTKDITDDLKKCGLKLDQDTVLKYLREAAEELPE
jgi:regulator of replication initiation timing